METAIETLFQNLLVWKNLPSYQAERRIDLFLSIYIKDYLEKNPAQENWDYQVLSIRAKDLLLG